MKRCPYKEMNCNDCQCYKGKGYNESCREGYTKNWRKMKKKETQQKEESKQSICWDCIRSAAPKGVRCIWDASKGRKLPEGVECTQVETDKRTPYLKTVVHTCPQFLSVYDKANQQLLEAVRRKA